jgi:hypothetical protein
VLSDSEDGLQSGTRRAGAAAMGAVGIIMMRGPRAPIYLGNKVRRNLGRSHRCAVAACQCLEDEVPSHEGNRRVPRVPLLLALALSFKLRQHESRRHTYSLHKPLFFGTVASEHAEADGISEAGVAKRGRRCRWR